MNNPPAYLEILIYSINNTIKKSIQKDPLKIKSILDKIQPNKLFSQNNITIQGTTAYSVYPSKSICRMDFIMDGYPEWISMDPSVEITQISEQDFKDKYKPEEISPDKLMPDNKHHGFTVIELICGDKLYIEVYGKAKTKIERIHLIQQLLSASTLFYKRKEGGVIFINPAHIINLTFYPGLRDAPSNVWSAQII